LYLDEVGARAEKTRSRDLPSWDLSMRQTCDIEMLLNGAFSPLAGFLGEKDYRSVLAKTRLKEPAPARSPGRARAAGNGNGKPVDGDPAKPDWQKRKPRSA
jgi:hypothetical protein